MIRALHRTDSGELRTALGLPEVRDALASGQGLLWVDLDTADPAGRALLEHDFCFHRLAVDDCYNGHLDTPKIDDYDTYLFIEAPSIDYSTDANRLNLTEIGLFLGPHYVVSVHEFPIHPVDQLVERAQQNAPFIAHGADFLAQAILDVMVDEVLPAVEAMDEKLDDLERAILERPDPEHLADVLLLKRNTLRLRRSVLPQRDLVNRLSRGEFPKLISPEALIFYRDVYDHVIRINETVDNLRELLTTALEAHLSLIAVRQNEVMKQLAAWAAILAVPTAVAGIYGMNFEFMPELRWRFGYALVMTAIVTTCAFLYARFKRAGWL
jgi:magnesium transporter